MWRNWQTHQTQNLTGNHVGSSPTIGTKKSIAKLCFLFCKLVGLEKEGLSFVSVKADTKLKTKTKSSCRTLPLIPACEQMLKKMKKEQEQNRKVCGMGKRIRPDFLSQHFPDFLVSHKMKRIRFHDLRHSDISTTSNIYTHLDFSSKVSSANAIVSIFPENTKV